jgi:hypothetical protein
VLRQPADTQPADQLDSGASHPIQDPLQDPPSIVSPNTYDAVATLLPASTEVVEEHRSGGVVLAVEKNVWVN